MTSSTSTIFGIELAPLAGGRRLPHELVREHQRDRLLAAFVDVAHEQRLEAVSLLEVAQHARVSLTALYKLFSNKEALATAVAQRFVDGILAAMGTGDRTSASRTLGENAVRIVVSFYVRLQEERLATQAFFHHISNFCAGTYQARQQMTLAIAADLDAAFAEAYPATSNQAVLPIETHWSVVESMYETISNELDKSRPRSLDQLASQTAAWLLAIYCGCGVDLRASLPGASVGDLATSRTEAFPCTRPASDLGRG